MNEPTAHRAPSAPEKAETADELGRMLHMSPRARLGLEGKQKAIFLIGGYTGSGNYGDLAQFQAAVALLAQLGDELAVLPVLELGSLSAHRGHGLAAQGGFDPDCWLAFERPSETADAAAIDAGLMPAALPGSLTATAAYLYGGGYLNARWGGRRLAMVEAVDDLCASAGLGVPALHSSGLQIEPDWLRTAAPGERATLARVDRLGVRDPISLQAAGNGLPPAELTGDDAIGVIAGRAAGVPAPADGERFSINLHYGEAEWVTSDPERLMGFLRGLVRGLATAAGTAPDIQPLIAYEDQRTSERPRLGRLTQEAVSLRAARSVAEPLLLRPANLDGLVGTLRRADLTVSCSYHVALTSLMLGVPCVLVRANGYYDQKAEALRRDFELPPEFFPSVDSEAGDAATLVSRSLAAGRPSEAALARAGERLTQRRLRAEGEILARVRESLERPAAEPRAAAHARDEHYERTLHAFDLAAKRIDELHELAAWQRSRLADIERSASWRLTAPLRWVKGLRRRPN